LSGIGIMTVLQKDVGVNLDEDFYQGEQKNSEVE
jgi:hypothetical protein